MLHGILAGDNDMGALGCMRRDSRCKEVGAETASVSERKWKALAVGDT